MVCEEREASNPDGVCSECARQGSEWSGLWQAGVWRNDQPATSTCDVQAVLAELGWCAADVSAADADAGVWLLTPPAAALAQLHRQGWLVARTASGRVEVDLP